jgi:hypothetical protein
MISESDVLLMCTRTAVDSDLYGINCLVYLLKISWAMLTCCTCRSEVESKADQHALRCRFGVMNKPR